MLADPLVLVLPIPWKPLKLYISGANESIGCLLAQDAEDGIERAIYYLSLLLHNFECKYTHVEKLCLPLFHACTKLEYYLLRNEVLVICKFDIVKHLLNRPVLQGRLMKWAIKLNAFALTYVPLLTMKGKVLADFITQHLRTSRWRIWGSQQLCWPTTLDFKLWWFMNTWECRNWHNYHQPNKKGIKVLKVNWYGVFE